jgi:glycosyltransferase involved in cell wall biosynthesis
LATAIGIDVWAPSITGFGGGISKFSREVIRALDGRVRKVFGKYDSPGSWDGVPCSGAGRWPASLQTPVFAAQIICGSLYSPPHAIVSSHINFGPVARRIQQIRGVPYWLVAHGIDVVPELSQSRQLAIQTATGIIAVSRWTRNRLLSLSGIDPERVFIVPNTVDDETFCITRDTSTRNQYEIPNDAKVILTVARLSAQEAYKGCEQVLGALKQLRSEIGKVHYVVVGDGNDMPRLKQLAIDLDVREAVTFAGFVSDTQLAKYYGMADVFAMPSRGEGFGIVFLEAMACGVPVLAGNIDGSVDALCDGELGLLVDPNNQSEVVTGLIRLLTKHGPVWWYRPEELRSRMLDQFGRAKFRKKLLTVIR